MAQIDLKFATLKMLDGFNGTAIVNNTPSGTFAVNNAAGYVQGDSAMTITATGILPAGTRFTVAGEYGAALHTVLTHTETLTNTTSITFTPALNSTIADATLCTIQVGAAQGDTTLNIHGYTGIIHTCDQFIVAGETGLPTHTVLTHTEASTNTTAVTFLPALASAVAGATVITMVPHSIDITIGDGNLQYTEKRNMEYKINLGRLKYTRLGDQAPMDVSFDFVWEFITAASGDAAPTIEDCLKQKNLASNWVTTGVDPCEPYSIDIQVNYTPPCGGVERETITLQYFRYEELQHSIKEAQISVKGKCNVLQAEVARTAVA